MGLAAVKPQFQTQRLTAHLTNAHVAASIQPESSLMQQPWSDEQVLLHLRWENAPLIGEGGEARIFDIGGDQVLRLLRPGGNADAQQMRAKLLQKISAGHTTAAFRTPRVIDICHVGGRIAVIEERLTGITLAVALKTAHWTPQRR